jgi:hypothetical protein
MIPEFAEKCKLFFTFFSIFQKYIAKGNIRGYNGSKFGKAGAFA